MDPLVSTNAVPYGTTPEVRPATEGKDSATMVHSNFETFLRLLTTQLKNQDPQNPMDSSEFAVQLATFSGVEQQLRTNSLLEGLVGRSESVGLSDFAGWVGMEAQAQGQYHFDGSAVEVTPPVIANVERAVLVVSDAAGEEVGQIAIPNDGAPVTWLGTGTDGAVLPPGDYGFAVRGCRGDTPVETQPVQTWGRVTEVQQGADGPLLVLENGVRIPANEVTALRTPV